MNKQMLGLAVVYAAFGGPLSQAGVIYDLNADWSDAANPNGAWTYRHGTTALPSQANYLPSHFPAGQPAWAVAPFGAGHIPSWLRNSTPAVIAGMDFLIGDVIVHAHDNANGAGLGVANVIWTSPTDGFVDIHGAVWLARNIGRSTRFNLFHNSILLATGDLFTGDPFSRATPLEFSALNLATSAGDVIRLEILRTSTFGEFTGVNLTIDLSQPDAAIPEPSTLALVLPGAIGFFACARMRGWKPRAS